MEHGTGGPHKSAYNKVLTKKGSAPRKCTERVSGWAGPSNVTKSLYIANTANSEGNKTKLETACNFKVGKDLSFRNKTQYSI